MVLRFQSLEVERTRKMRGRRGRRGPYIDSPDAEHFTSCESEGQYKQGIRLRVYRDVVMWIYEARIQYCGIDSECTSLMTADKDI